MTVSQLIHDITSHIGSSHLRKTHLRVDVESRESILALQSSQFLVASWGSLFISDMFVFISSLQSPLKLHCSSLLLWIHCRAESSVSLQSQCRGLRRQLQYFTAPSLCVIVPQCATFRSSGAECSKVLLFHL